MSVKKRIQYLLGAARRAEVEGELRTARLLRRIAEEARPIDARSPVRGLPLEPTLGSCAE